MEPPLSAATPVSGLNLEAALLTRRDWHLPGNDQPAQLLRELEGGLSNTSFVLQVGDDRLVLRLPTHSTPVFDLDPGHEAAVLARAAQAGLAPPLIYASAEQRLLVTRYLSGVSGSPQQVERPGFITALARLLQQVHALEAPACVLSPKQKAQDYWTALRQLATIDSFRFEPLQTPMNRLMDQVWHQYPPSSCCHNDLVLDNILYSQDRLFLLDWEYAALGDPYFDLAALVLNFNMDQHQTRELLVAYEGQFQTTAQQHLRASQAIYLYLELLWYQLQGGLRDDPQLLERTRQRERSLLTLLAQLNLTEIP